MTDERDVLILRQKLELQKLNKAVARRNRRIAFLTARLRATEGSPIGSALLPDGRVIQLVPGPVLEDSLGQYALSEMG